MWVGEIVATVRKDSRVGVDEEGYYIVSCRLSKFESGKVDGYVRE